MLALLSSGLGSSLLQRYYFGSTSKAISELFPEHHYEFWKFNVVPKGVWADPKNKLRYLAWLETQLGITQLEQWYTQTPASIIAKGGILVLPFLCFKKKA
jgi:hypothetical protein